MPNSPNRLGALAVLLVLGGCATGTPRAPDPDQPAATRLTPVFELMGQKEFADAEEMLLRMRGETPDDVGVLTNLGIVYAHTARLDESTEALERAIELDPRNAIAHNELGITYRRSGRFEDAERAYRAAIEARPDYANAHYNLGVLLDLYLQRREQAIGHYQQYLALENPGDKQVQAWVKDLQRRTGQGPSTAAAGGEVERR